MALAALTVEEKSPTNSAWATYQPGTWILTKKAVRTVSYRSDSIEYRRRLLVGADDQGRAWFAEYKAPNPTGPWSFVQGHGGGGEQADTRVVMLPDETLVICGQAIRCHVSQLVHTDDWGNTRATNWVEAVSGILIKREEGFQGNDSKNRSVMRRADLTTVRVQTTGFKGKVLATFVQRFVQQTNGRTEWSIEMVVSAAVPGQQLSYRRWNGDDETKPANLEYTLLDWGFDAELLANHKRQHPSIDQKRRDEEAARVERMQAFWNRRFKHATGPDPRLRLSAVRGLAASPVVSPELKPQVIAVLKNALDDPIPEVRRYAAIGISRYKVTGLAERITKLAETDPDGRGEYVRALGLLADPAGITAILAATTDVGPYVRESAAQALGNFRTEPARQTLAQLSKDPNPGVRYHAIKALAEANDSRNQAVLIRALADSDPLVRSAAASGLAVVPSSESVAKLLPLLADTNELVRASVCSSLAAAHGVDRDKAGEALLPLMDDKSPLVQMTAIHALVKLKESRAVPRLMKLAQTVSSQKSLETMFGSPHLLAVMALGEIGDRRALPTLLKLVDNNELSDTTLDAIVQLGDPAAADPLWRRYQALSPPTNSQFPPRARLLNAIGRIGDASMRNELERLLEKAPPPDKKCIREAIEAINQRLSPNLSNPR